MSAQVPQWLRECRVIGRRYGFNAQSIARHNLLNLGVTACVLGLLWATARLTAAVPVWVALFGGGLGFGLLYFHLLILVVHESSHGMYLLHSNPLRRKALNRIAGRLCCIPFAINYVKHWEQGHIIHHRDPMRPGDPQAYNCKTGANFWLSFLCALFIPGYAQVERLFSKHNVKRGTSSKSTSLATIVFWIGVGYLTVHYLNWQTFFAELLGLQVLVALNQFKGSLEHGGEIANADNPWCRSRTTLFPLRWLVLPYNISLHFEHHLNYGVPWYHLPTFHKDVLRLMPLTEQRRYMNTNLLRQLSGAPLGNAAQS